MPRDNPHDRLVVIHTPFRGDIGIGLILHIEPPGPFAETRAKAHAQEWADDLEWGNVLVSKWIGDRHEVPEPHEGQFVIFDEAYASPPWHVSKLIKEAEREIVGQASRCPKQKQKPEIER